MTTAIVRAREVDTMVANVPVPQIHEQNQQSSKQFFISNNSSTNGKNDSNKKKEKGNASKNVGSSKRTKAVSRLSTTNDQATSPAKSPNKSILPMSIGPVNSPISLGGSSELVNIRRISRGQSFRHSPILTRQNIVYGDGEKEKEPGKVISYISILIQDFQWALTDLGWECIDIGTGTSTTASSGRRGSINKRKLLDERFQLLEKWAYFVDCSLTDDSRSFHGLTRVFDMTESASSLQFLAAAFRDVVTYRIFALDAVGPDEVLFSGGRVNELILKPVHEELVGDVLVRKRSSDEIKVTGTCDEIYLSQSIEVNRTDAVVCSVFGFQPGCDLSKYAGLNQGLDVFLSTLVAVRTLKNVLLLSQIAQLATIMAATILVRRKVGERNHDKFAFERLHNRLMDTNVSFKLSMNNDTMVEAVQLGADLRNRFFGHLAVDDIASFIEFHWTRLPDRSPSMCDVPICNILDYCSAVKTLLDDLVNSENQTFYLGFMNLPTREEVNVLQQQSKSNIQIAKLYVQARLVSVITVCCIAQLTGGTNAPATFFLGDVPCIRNSNPVRLGDGIKLRTSNPGDSEGIDNIVYNLLAGRDSRLAKNSFDTQQFPLAAYLFSEVPSNAVQRIIQNWSTLPQLNNNTAKDILKVLPSSTLLVICEEFASMVPTRADATKRIIQGLNTKHADTELMYFL